MFSPQNVRARLSAATVAGLAVALLATPIQAATPQDDSSQVVLHNLNLTPDTRTEAVKLFAKLSEGAMEACGASYFSVIPHRQAVRASECWHNSMSDVVQRIDNPRLTAVFERRGMPQVITSPGDTAGGR
jgi:UrcA family protein